LAPGSAAAQTISATLWAGTNSGQILVFLLNIPVGGAEKRNTEKATAMLAKEIQLKHKAPVINIQVAISLNLHFGRKRFRINISTQSQGCQIFLGA
jgi:hypothetical protein